MLARGELRPREGRASDGWGSGGRVAPAAISPATAVATPKIKPLRFMADSLTTPGPIPPLIFP